MRLVKSSIQNYQFTIVIYIALVFMGISSVLFMPRSEDPKTNLPMANIIAIYPGASPKDIEKLVADPLEEAINELNDIKKIKTKIREGVAVIFVEFFYESDHAERLSELEDKVFGERERLPKELYDLKVIKQDVTNVNIMQIAISTEDSFSLDLQEHAENLKNKIERVSGVKKVEIHGDAEEIVEVNVDLEKMSALRIPLKALFGKLQSYNLNIPAGSVFIEDKKLNVQGSGNYENLEEIRNTVLHSNSGSPVYLREIADVRLGYKEHDYQAFLNSQPSVFVTVQQKSGTDIFIITDEIKSVIDQYRSKLINGLDIRIAFDQSKSVENRIENFALNLFEGIFLVALLIFFVVGVRAAGIISFVIPLSFLIGIGFVNLYGYGIQQMTITGLVIALGLLVDNAIVVTENIHSFLKRGMTGREAVIKATSQVAWPVISSTITTIFAFVPMLTMQNSSGDFIRSMPVTVVFTLLASLFVSLTFTPLISSRFFASKDFSKENKIQKNIDVFIETKYRFRLAWSLKHSKKVIIYALLSLILSFVLAGFLGVSMFPKAEKSQFLINIELPQSSSIDASYSVLREVEKTLDSYKEISFYMSNLGKGNPFIFYNHKSKQKASNYAEIFVNIEGYSQDVRERIVKELREKFTGKHFASIEVREFEQGPPTDAPIAIRVLGENLEQLKKLSADVEAMVRSSEGTINIDNPASKIAMDLKIKISREKASLYGVELHEIDQVIRMVSNGLTATKYRDKNGDEFDLVLYASEDKKLGPDIFDQVYIVNNRSVAIPLKQVANIEFQQGYGLIEHHLLERGFTITADVSGRLTSEVTAEIEKKLQAYSWPEAYHFKVAGENEAQKESFGGMAQASVLALLLIYAILVLQFKSFTQPLIVFAAIPLAMIGGTLGLLLTGNSFSFTAFVGLTSLIGIVINNSILLVEYSNQLIADGKKLIDAIKIAAEARFTPIILTTLTTIGGLLPLTLQGGDMWAPMGWVIIGGLSTSTIMTLLVIPVLYSKLTAKNR